MKNGRGPNSCRQGKNRAENLESLPSFQRRLVENQGHSPSSRGYNSFPKEANEPKESLKNIFFLQSVQLRHVEHCITLNRRDEWGHMSV